MNERRGVSLVETIVASAAMLLLLAIAAQAACLVSRGVRIAPAGDPMDLALALEHIEREVRVAARVVVPPPTLGTGSLRPTSGCLYLVTPDGAGVLLYLKDSCLLRTRLDARGGRRTDLLARGVNQVTFRARGGSLPRVQIALSSGDALTVGQVPLLSPRPPIAAGGLGHALR